MSNPIQKKILRDSANSAVGHLSLRFSAAGVGNPKRVAEELAAHVLGCKPLETYLRETPLTEEEIQTLEKLAARIEAGEPLQYVVGQVDFFGLEIRCDPRALIPRPETELLVEEILVSKVWKKARPRVVEVGTGTGCISLALASHHPSARLLAIDISPGALELARENARALRLGKNIDWREGDLLEGIAPSSCDAVVANLPYISTGDWKGLERGVRDHEPRAALDAGPSGMELIETLSFQARTALVPGGMLFLEFGFDQGKAVFQCLEKKGYAGIRIEKDLVGHDRMAIAQVPA